MTVTATVLELDRLCQIPEHQAIRAHASALILDLEGDPQAAATLEDRSRRYRQKLDRARQWRDSVMTHHSRGGPDDGAPASRARLRFSAMVARSGQTNSCRAD